MDTTKIQPAINYQYPDLVNGEDFITMKNEQGKYELFWYREDIEKPTQAEIDEWYVQSVPINERKLAYPSIEDQLDKIFHDGLEAWKADMIQPIKDKFPK